MADLVSRPSRTLSLEMGARRNGRTNTKYVVEISMHPHFHRHHLCSRGPYSGGPERPKRTRNLSASTYASRMHDVAHAHSPAPCSFPSTPGIPNTIEMASRALAVADSDRHMCLQPSMPWRTLVNQTDAPYQPPHTAQAWTPPPVLSPGEPPRAAPTGQWPAASIATPDALVRSARRPIRGGRARAQRGAETYRAQCTGRFCCATQSQSKGCASTHLSPACLERSITQILRRRHGMVYK